MTLAQAFSELERGTLYVAWRRDNPGEHARLVRLRAGQHVAVPFVSFTGRGLAEYARGRDGLELLRRGRLYQRWARANPVEARRLETLGPAAPPMATPTGRALLAFARLVDRPDPDPLWQRDLVYTTNLSAWHGELRQAARAAGFSVVAVLADALADPNATASLNELKLLRNELRHNGWRIVGWAATITGAHLGRTMRHPIALQPGVIVDIDPEASATRAARLVDEHELDGWIANMEAWNEREHAWAVGPWVDTYLSRSGAPLAGSVLSSDNPTWAREFPYNELVSARASIQPQVYGNVHPAYTIANATAVLELAGVPDTLVNMTLGTYGDTGHPIPWADYRTWDGPRGIYLGERITAADYNRLA